MIQCRQRLSSLLVAAAVLVLATWHSRAAGSAETSALLKPYSAWTLSDAVGILTNSPWARKETFTRVIGGIGSGVSGEKEIYTTFFVRILSAAPVREAYARVRQIQAGYSELDEAERRVLDDALNPGLDLDVGRWIVVALAYRSNDPNVELQIRRSLEVQTTQTMRLRAYLSTQRTPQVPSAAYFPASEEAVGAKFVFPRFIEGQPVVSPEDGAVIFELDLPGFDPDIRVRFPLAPMVVRGELVL